MRHLKLFLLASCFFVMFIIGGAYGATIYYVAPSGDDSNPGTQSEPFLTIQKAANVVNAGDSVIVKDGIYTDTLAPRNFIVSLNRGDTYDNWIIFMSENKWGAVLDGQNNTTGYGWNFGENANYVRVENFEIKGCGWGGFWSNSQKAHHVYIYGCNIHHIGRRCTDNAYGQAGVFQGGGTSYHTYDSNVIHHIGRYANGEKGCQNETHYWQNHDHGLYLCGSNTLVINNIFYENLAGWCITSGCWDSVTNDRIINNIFAFPNPNRKGYILVHAYKDGNFNTLIKNNIFYKPNGYAIRRYGPSKVVDMVVKNNLVYGTELIEDQDDYVNLVVKNNIEGKDPLFFDPENYDFRLKSDSPAFDAGYSK